MTRVDRSADREKLAELERAVRELAREIAAERWSAPPGEDADRGPADGFSRDARPADAPRFDLESLDSLGRLELLAALEERFEVELTEDLLPELVSAATAARLLADVRRTAAQRAAARPAPAQLAGTGRGRPERS